MSKLLQHNYLVYVFLILIFPLNVVYLLCKIVIGYNKICQPTAIFLCVLLCLRLYVRMDRLAWFYGRDGILI